MAEQTPYNSEDLNFDEVEFAENPDPRCSCILVLDCSNSMNRIEGYSNSPIDELNKGLQVFKEKLSNDALASKRVEVTVLKFETNVEVINEFETADSFEPQQLEASGLTSMGAAIEKAIQMLNQRKAVYKANGIAYYRPWIFLITDGEPTDEWTNAASLVHDGERKKQFAFFAVGVQGANMDILKQISVREPLMLKGLDFTSLFQWLSNSMSTVSNSQENEQINLPKVDWTTL